jgi:hypothetical protein
VQNAKQGSLEATLLLFRGDTGITNRYQYNPDLSYQ